MLFSGAAKEFVIDAGYEPAYGARPLRRAIQRHLQDPLSMAILEGDFVAGSRIEVGLVTSESGVPELTFHEKRPEGEPIEDTE